MAVISCSNTPHFFPCQFDGIFYKSDLFLLKTNRKNPGLKLQRSSNGERPDSAFSGLHCMVRAFQALSPSTQPEKCGDAKPSWKGWGGAQGSTEQGLLFPTHALALRFAGGSASFHADMVCKSKTKSDLLTIPGRRCPTGLLWAQRKSRATTLSKELGSSWTLFLWGAIRDKRKTN